MAGRHAGTTRHGDMSPTSRSPATAGSAAERALLFSGRVVLASLFVR